MKVIVRHVFGYTVGTYHMDQLPARGDKVALQDQDGVYVPHLVEDRVIYGSRVDAGAVDPVLVVSRPEKS